MENEDKSKKQKKKINILLIIIIALLIIALTASIYFYWLWRDCQKELDKKQDEITMLEERLGEAEETPAEPESEPDVPSDLPVVVFSPGGLFTDTEKAELTTKMINPLRDWNLDQGQTIVSIHVQEHFATPDQYTIDVIYSNGVYEGFLYGNVDAPEQEWWHPTCLDACSFTPEFEAEYPEVVVGS